MARKSRNRAKRGKLRPREARGDNGGRGLHLKLNYHSRKFIGVLNGIDTGACLKGQNSANDVQGKTENKEAIRRDLGLSSADVRKPLIITSPRENYILDDEYLYSCTFKQVVVMGIQDLYLNLYYSLYGHVETIAREIQRGANAEGVEASVWQVVPVWVIMRNYSALAVR
ncbi:hypothetical protein FNV43_RR00482 [Rhamnella rubrinervis]|uniref:Flavodoxin-like domain-containing protein n=1 Tax=Rhamnella rubrinervis TaxID=2594499 RepID=A0A8K0MSG1_9ROSA|nr:hypothetical protein FNV43_RR00482 [Rhamnella rubrinervis]